MFMEADSPKICSWWTGEPIISTGWFYSSSEGLGTRRADGIIFSPSPNSKAGKDQGFSSKSGRESKFSLACLFCSMQAFNGLDEAHSHQRGQSALLSLTNSNIILIWKTLSQTLQNNVQPNTWEPESPVKLTLRVVRWIVMFPLTEEMRVDFWTCMVWSCHGISNWNVSFSELRKDFEDSRFRFGESC